MGEEEEEDVVVVDADAVEEAEVVVDEEDEDVVVVVVASVLVVSCLLQTPSSNPIISIPNKSFLTIIISPNRRRSDGLQKDKRRARVRMSLERGGGKKERKFERNR